MLSKTGAPLEILKQLESTEVPETYAGEFECVVSREDAEGSWYFGDKLLSSSSKHVISSRRGRHTLSVKDVKKEDQGKYTFKVGDFKTSASLKMKCETKFHYSEELLWSLFLMVPPVLCCSLLMLAMSLSSHFSAPSDLDAASG